MTGEDSDAAAPPGGKATSGVKKRRLEALEQQAAPKPKRGKSKSNNLQLTSNIQIRTQAPAIQKDGASYPDDYQPLSTALCSGPVGAALKLPPSAGSANGLKAAQNILRDVGLNEQSIRAGGTVEDLAANAASLQGPLCLGARPRQKRRVANAETGPLAGKLMSSTARKKAGLDLQKSEITADVAETLHKLWLDYVSKLGKHLKPEQLSWLVNKELDLHGCKLKVVESKNPMHVGLEGIVIKESRSAFHLATPTEEQDGSQSVLLRVIPKQISAFCFEWPNNGLLMRIAGWNMRK